MNMPRDKETGKTRGFGFLMYEDQRSTVLAVDNLNGAQVLGKVLRVDHVKNYKQPRTKGEDGEWVDAEEQSLNARPELVVGTSVYLSLIIQLSITVLSDDDAASDSSLSSGPSIDPEDPMRDYLISQRKEQKALKKTKKSKGKHKDETPDERRARKERKKEKKARKLQKKSDGIKGVEELLNTLTRRRSRDARSRSRSRSPKLRYHSRSRSPVRNAREMRSSSRYKGDDDDEVRRRRSYDRV